MTQTSRASDVLKAVTLAGLALMLYSKISSSALGYYINQRFFWLPYVGLILLLTMALTVIYGVMRRRDVLPADQLHIDTSSLLPAHSHGVPWWVAGLLLVPVVMGLAFPNRTLSAGALANRGLNSAAPGRAASVAAPATANSREGKSILAWLQEFSRNGAEASMGKDVDVIGFVYRDERTPADQFWVARYTLACCVADASGIGMVVRGYQQGSALGEGAWVRVRGKIALGQLNGERLPVIAAETVEVTAEPAQPYLFQ